MGLNDTVSAERITISFFGKRNAGKSSVVNAVTKQNIAIVSNVLGTTTDPVKKAMEILPIGPVLIIDTPGIDDSGTLGKMRVDKTLDVINKTHIAVLVADVNSGITEYEKDLINIFNKKQIPFIVCFNKSDLLSEDISKNISLKENEVLISALNKKGIDDLLNLIIKKADIVKTDKFILKDLVNRNDNVVLVIPIDAAAPKGRIILPQQQVLRELLDIGAVITVCQDTELGVALKNLKNMPKLVITDSQAFGKIKNTVPLNVMLTSFSVLFARYKGELNSLINGVKAFKNLKENDKVLISEGCTHRRQCGDIGTEKLPFWMQKYLGFNLNFEFTSGTEFKKDLSEYKLIVHCGGCMLNEKEMKYRINIANENKVPITNYGILIAFINGILNRALEPFKDINI